MIDKIMDKLRYHDTDVGVILTKSIACDEIKTKLVSLEGNIKTYKVQFLISCALVHEMEIKVDDSLDEKELFVVDLLTVSHVNIRLEKQMLIDWKFQLQKNSYVDMDPRIRDFKFKDISITDLKVEDFMGALNTSFHKVKLTNVKFILGFQFQHVNIMNIIKCEGLERMKRFEIIHSIMIEQTTITSELLAALQRGIIYDMTIKNCLFSFVDNIVLNTNLHTLSLLNLGLTKIPNFNPSTSPNLKLIDLSGNNILYIPNNWIHSLNSNTEVILRGSTVDFNKISSHSMNFINIKDIKFTL